MTAVADQRDAFAQTFGSGRGVKRTVEVVGDIDLSCLGRRLEPFRLAPGGWWADMTGCRDFDTETTGFDSDPDKHLCNDLTCVTYGFKSPDGQPSNWLTLGSRRSRSDMPDDVYGAVGRYGQTGPVRLARLQHTLVGGGEVVHGWLLMDALTRELCYAHCTHAHEMSGVIMSRVAPLLAVAP